MKIPILINHDPRLPPVGRLKVEGDRLFVEFERDVRITREQFFEIFSGAGVRMLEVGEEEDGTFIVRRGEILEFSLTSTPKEARRK